MPPRADVAAIERDVSLHESQFYLAGDRRRWIRFANSKEAIGEKGESAVPLPFPPTWQYIQ